MESKLEDFLAHCSGLDFGTISLSKEAREFYGKFNYENILLCRSLPESIRKETKKFLKAYSGIAENEADDTSDFFKNYYAPAWSIIYWLTHSEIVNDHLCEEDIKNAITAHAMALTLHSLDDHLNDGQIPASHLTLLLRSQSWLLMTAALDHLAAGDGMRTGLVRNFINDYYSSICGQQADDSLDSYCSLFRKQMATWLTAPVLLAGKASDKDGFAGVVQTAYESFGIAWRLLDDIQDIGKDMLAGSHSAVYILLPEDIRRLWDQGPGKNSGFDDDRAGAIVDCIRADGIVEQLQERACREMESAARMVEGLNLTGLAEEFRCLAKPLGTRRYEFVNADVQPNKIPVENKKVLSIEVTTHCNSACTHCFVRAGMTEPASLSLGVVKDILTEGYDLEYRNLHITGGEPLLYKDLFTVLDYAFHLGYKSVFLNTNGTLLTDEVAGRLGSYKGLKISVSLEGRKPLHESVRGNNSYKRAVEGIEKALDIGIYLCIFTTVCKSILPYLGYFVDELYEEFRGVQHVTLIQLIRVKKDTFDLSKELLDPDDFIQFVQAATLLNLLGYRTLILNNPLTAVVSKKLGIRGIPESAPLHRAGDLIVLASRRVAAAHSSRNDFGRYELGMLENVLASKEYRSAVAPDDTACPTCRYFRLCRESGMIRPSPWYRDMRCDIPYCRRVLDRAALYS